MAHTIQRLPGEPIIVVTYEEPFDYTTTNFDTIFREVGKQVAGIEGTVFAINDASSLKLNFSTLVTALTNALFNPLSKYPGQDRTTGLLVGKGMLFDVAQKAAGRKQHGEVRLAIFQTTEEAIEYARSQLKRS